MGQITRQDFENIEIRVISGGKIIVKGNVEETYEDLNNHTNNDR